MAASGAAIAAIIANAIKASGTVVSITPSEFLKVVRKVEAPLVIYLKGPNDQVKIEDGGIRVTLWQPVSPWGRVKLAQAKLFQRAVETYFAEVLFPKSGQITAGTIVIRR